jgi:hypothetical protein
VIDENLHLAKKGKISMDHLKNQQENDVLSEMGEQELNTITGGAGVAEIVSNSFSGVKGLYQAGKDLGVPKALNVAMAGTLGPALGASRAIKGAFPGSEAIRQQVVLKTQKGLAKQ